MAQSFQSDSAATIILDTSAAINLVSSGFGTEILDVFPARFLITETVMSELHAGRENGWPHADQVDALCSDSNLSVVKMEASSIDVFERLVIGATRNTLDDGEAATLAVANDLDCSAMIDERKAIRICKEQFPKVELLASVDLFLHVNVQKCLGLQRLEEALFNALTGARMRVLPQHLEWVINVLGLERASKCPSLPRQALDLHIG